MLGGVACGLLTLVSGVFLYTGDFCANGWLLHSMYRWSYNAVRGLAPLPPPSPSCGPSQRDCGGPRESFTPPGVPRCLAVPPLRCDWR